MSDLDAFAPLNASGSTARRARASVEWEPLPIDEATPAPPVRFGKLGEPSRRWEYRSAIGQLEGYVCRFERRQPDGTTSKEFRPLRYGRLNGRIGWHWKGWQEGRPLYRLVEALARPGAIIIVCEGEKAADACRVLFPECEPVSPMNGARSPSKTDWTPLRGRDVVIAPDRDEAGAAFASAVAELLRAAGAARVGWLRADAIAATRIEGMARVERLGPIPEGWDLADAVEDGWTADAIAELAIASPLFEFPTAIADADLGSTFRLTAKSLLKRVPGSEGGFEWRPVSAAVEVAAYTRNADNEDWGRLLVFSDRDGKPHRWAMPMSLLAGDGRAYLERLLSLGLVIGPSRFAREALHEYIATARPTRRARCVPRVGWQGAVFVLPDETIGADPGSEEVLLQTTSGGEHAFRCRGSLAGWRQQIGRYAVGNSRLTLALCAAAAAPLLALVGAEGGGFHFRGSSSIGKSTTLFVAGSAWGGIGDGGVRSYVRQWRTTDNGLEAMAAGHCDSLLCLDELSQIDAKAAAHASYMLANGVGKVRAGRSGEGRPVAEWRVLFLSSGEISLADKLAEDGRSRRAAAGQNVRVIDLPADADAGLGLFENLHGFATAAALAAHLRDEAVRENFGHPMRAFLRRLVIEPGAGETVAAARRDFVEAYCPEDADGQVKRVAARFGLLAGAGELATAFGIFPWPIGEAEAACARCFRDWIKARGGLGAEEVSEGVRHVVDFLQTHGPTHFETWGETIHVSREDGSPERVDEFIRGRVQKRYGWRRKGDGGVWEYFVSIAGMRDLTRGFDQREVIKELRARGMVKPDADGASARKVRIPHEPQQRVYHFPGSALAGDGED